MKSGITLPDEVLEKYLTDTGEDDSDASELDAADESTVDDELDTPEEADEADDEAQDDDDDTDEEDAEEEDPADLDEDEEDEGSEDTDSDEESPDEDPESEAFFDRREIDRIENEEARAVAQRAYKSMQAAFTKKTQALATKEREVEALQGEFDAFLQELQSPEGAEEFLLRVALARPDVFEAASLRFADLTEDPDEKQRFDREQQLKQRERELERKEREGRLSAEQARTEEIKSLTKRAATAAGLDATELEIAQHYVANRIYKNRAEGRSDISDEEIASAVKLAAKHLGREKERIRQAAEREQRKKQQERVKQRAKAKRRPPPPRSSAAPGASRKKAKPPEGGDSLGWAINTALGLDDTE